LGFPEKHSNDAEGNEAVGGDSKGGIGKNKRMRSLKRMIKMPPKAQREIFSESFLDTDLRVKKSTNSKRNLIKKIRKRIIL